MNTTAPAPSHLRRGRWAGLIGLFAAVSLAAPALAVTASIGNAPTDRSSVDTWVNFTIVDTNHPAPFDGYFTSIDYFAERAGTVRFVVVDSDATVTWISDALVVDAGGAGSLALDFPVGVSAGSNLGVYSGGEGVISYDLDSAAEPASFEGEGAGLPFVGESLNFVDHSDRFYSMTADVEASSPQICKNGGWETYGYPNQGQCIASVVANENSGH